MRPTLWYWLRILCNGVKVPSHLSHSLKGECDVSEGFIPSHGITKVRPCEGLRGDT